MSYKTKLLLSKNDGDWRRRSAMIFKAKSTVAFNEFSKQCARKLYPNQTITNSTKINLYDIQKGLTPIDDDNDTPISELYEDNDIYQNCQILVVLPLIHINGIQNPSDSQKNDLKQEMELLSYLSVTNTSSISSHSIFGPSSMGYPSSIHSTNRSFHTLSSLHKLNHNNLPLNRTRSYIETPLLLSRKPMDKSPNTTLSPIQLPQISNIKKIASKIDTNNDNDNNNINRMTQQLERNNDMNDRSDIDGNIMYDDMDKNKEQSEEDEDELICTLRNEDDDGMDINIKDDISIQSSINGKRARRDFEPSLNDKRPKKKRKKKRKNNTHNINVYDIEFNHNDNDKIMDKMDNVEIIENGNDDKQDMMERNLMKKDIKKKKQKKKKKITEIDSCDVTNVPLQTESNGKTGKSLSMNGNNKKKKDKQHDNSNDKEEMDTDNEDGDDLREIEGEDENKNNDNDSDSSSSEYEEIVEYMMVEMRLGNSDSFDLHRYNKCILKNMMNDNNMYQSIKLKKKQQTEEYQGTYCQTLGTHLFFKEIDNNNSNQNENENQNHNQQNKDKQLQYVDKTDIKCVFSRFKPRFYS